MKRPRHHQHRDTKGKVSEVKLYMTAENAVDGCLAEGLELANTLLSGGKQPSG